MHRPHKPAPTTNCQALDWSAHSRTSRRVLTMETATIACQRMPAPAANCSAVQEQCRSHIDVPLFGGEPQWTPASHRALHDGKRPGHTNTRRKRESVVTHGQDAGVCKPPVPAVRLAPRAQRCAVREQQRYDGQVPLSGGEVERRHAVAAHTCLAGWGPTARRASPAWPQESASVHTHHLFVLRLRRRRASTASRQTRLAHVRPQCEGVSTYGEHAVHSHGSHWRKRVGDNRVLRALRGLRSGAFTRQTRLR
jgi:hypothetical protein